jgi:hypothetical protein
MSCDNPLGNPNCVVRQNSVLLAEADQSTRGLMFQEPFLWPITRARVNP